MIAREKLHELHRLFSDKCDEVTRGGTTDLEGEWIDFLSSLDCLCIRWQIIGSEFFNLMNAGVFRRETICIPDPFSISRRGGRNVIDGRPSDTERCDYILIPVEVALKSLVVGALS